MVRLCWVLAVVCGCSSGNARRPEGPPPIYEPRPIVSYEPPASSPAPDPVDALLEGPEPAVAGPDVTEPAGTLAPTSLPAPITTEALPAAPGVATRPVTPAATSSATSTATDAAPVNSKP